MSRPDDENVERGAAEELSGAPLTDTERQVSQPPQDREADDGGSAGVKRGQSPE